MKIRYTGTYEGLAEGIEAEHITHQEACPTDEGRNAYMHHNDIADVADEVAAGHLSTSIWQVVEPEPEPESGDDKKGKGKGKPATLTDPSPAAGLAPETTPETTGEVN